MHFFFKKPSPPRPGNTTGSHLSRAGARKRAIYQPDLKTSTRRFSKLRAPITQQAADLNRNTGVVGGAGALITPEVTWRSYAGIPYLGNRVFGLADSLAGSSVIHSFGAPLARAAAAAEGGAKLKMADKTPGGSQKASSKVIS